MTTHHTYVAIHVFLTVLATAFVVARFAAKCITANQINLTSDDALLAAALLLMYTLFAGAILAITLGNAGEHAYALTNSQLEVTAMMGPYCFPHPVLLNPSHLVSSAINGYSGHSISRFCIVTTILKKLTPIANILVAVFRIISIVRVNFRGDMTDDLAAAMAWMYAQLSTAIILACCPLLRPVFEKMIPRQLTRIRRNTSMSSQNTSQRIQKTTNILVHPNSTETRSRPLGIIIHDDANVEPIGPKFEVERSQPVSGRRLSCLF
ncbi:hypothetical protein PSPO01_13854 [Paraphaeosphaeria sporulosa]